MSFNFRGTGKTTARALRSIADALLHPNTTIAVVPDDFSVNHVDQSFKDLERFAEIIRWICKCLGITLDVELTVHAVLLTSPITRMREEHNQKCDQTACDTDKKFSAVSNADAVVASPASEVKHTLASFDLRTSEGHKALVDACRKLNDQRNDSPSQDELAKGESDFAEGRYSDLKSVKSRIIGRRLADCWRKNYPGRVLPKGTEIVQQRLVTTIDVSLMESSSKSDSFLDGFGRPVRQVAAERLAESLRKAYPGSVLPKGTEIVQQQPAGEDSKPEASIPNAQSDADRDFIHELNSNRTLREVCHVVDSHMAKELGFQNLREYRDAVRASIMSFKTSPEQSQAQPQRDIPEVSIPHDLNSGISPRIMAIDVQRDRFLYVVWDGTQVIERGRAYDYKSLAKIALETSVSSDHVRIDCGFCQEAVLATCRTYGWVPCKLHSTATPRFMSKSSEPPIFCIQDTRDARDSLTFGDCEYIAAQEIPSL